jgi:phosphatidylinositol alpha-mannosyltransferase
VVLAPHGTYDLRRRRPAPAPRRGGYRVLFVGRFEPRKGVEHLVDAMARVQRDLRSARLVVVGDGPSRDSLERRARDAGVDALFAGRISDDALPSYYQAADLICAPATGGESFGLVLLEALAAGRPVIATGIDGYRELASGAECVRLVAPADAGALAAEIATLLASGERRARLGAAGPAFARRFDWGAVARTLEGHYVALATSAPAARTT